MSIIRDVLKRAGAEEVKVLDLRPGDLFVTTADQYAISGIFVRFDECNCELEYRAEGGKIADVEGVLNGQRWYLMERAPVAEPTGWGAIVEVDGVKYSHAPDDPQDADTWVSGGGSWSTWDRLTSAGPVKVLFEGIIND